MGSAAPSSSEDSSQRRKRIVTAPRPASAPPKPPRPTQKSSSFSPSRELTAQEKQYAGFDTRQESVSQRSDRLSSERAKAESIRSKYTPGFEALRRGEMKTPVTGTDRQQMADPTPSPAPTMTKAQQVAGARAAGMAQNRESISELQGRASEARNPISKLNLENQIKQLKQGGRPVTTTKPSGETLTVGVVRDGRFSGRQQYDPSTGATKYDPLKGAYTGKGTGMVSSPATQQATAPQPTSSPEPLKTSVPIPATGISEAARRAMISGGAGGATTRRYLSKRR